MQNSNYRDQITERLTALQKESALSEETRRTVILDQQSVGRLSRMDAMQQQAMAQATERRRAVERQKLEAALARIDADEFGFCADCGEDIPPARLALDPTVLRCISCARD